MMKVPYQYRPLGENQIRVLVADPRYDNTWTFQHITLDQKQTYNAVSYTWGEPTLRPHPLLHVESHIVETGGTTLDALNAATRFEPQAPIWIDAICINQQDSDEKAKQIPLMGKVYSQASSVLIVLPSPKPSEAASAGLQESSLDLAGVVRDMAALPNNSKKSHLTIERPVTTSMAKSSFLLSHLLTQRWWNRLWTFQEYVLAERPVFIYGQSVIMNETLLRFVRLYNDLNLKEAEAFVSPASFRDRFRSTQHELVDQPSAEEQDATTILLSLQEHRERLVRLKNVVDAEALFDADMDVLTSTFRRDASEACDKIFGLLGVLQSDALRAVQNLIGRTQQEIYTFVGCHILSSQASGPRRFSLLHHIDTITRLDSLPSWVPNFHSRGCAIPLDPRQRSGTYLFNASGSVPAACEQILGAGSSIPTFKLRALVLDEVGDTVDCKTYRWNLYPQPTRFSSAAAQLDFEEECRQLAATVARRHLTSAHQLEGAALAYCATLVAGSRRQGNATSTSSSYAQWNPPLEAYRSYRRRIKTMADPTYDFLHMGMNPGSRTRLPPSSPLELAPHKIGDQGFEFHQRFYEVCAGRTFLSTVGGRLGLGPSSTMKGDLVVLVCGATTPFVMRRVIVDDGSTATKTLATTYRFVGEAYVNGVMNGEAFEGVAATEKICWLTLS